MALKTMKLDCDLTETELLARGRKVAELVRQIQEAEEVKKADARSAKETIDALKKDLAEVSGEVRNKKTLRDVEIITEEHVTENVFKIVTRRKDTGAVVDTRPMTPEERQRVLPFEVIEGGKQAKVGLVLNGKKAGEATVNLGEKIKEADKKKAAAGGKGKAGGGGRAMPGHRQDAPPIDPPGGMTWDDAKEASRRKDAEDGKVAGDTAPVPAGQKGQRKRGQGPESEE